MDSPSKNLKLSRMSNISIKQLTNTPVSRYSNHYSSKASKSAAGSGILGDGISLLASVEFNKSGLQNIKEAEILCTEGEGDPLKFVASDILLTAT